MTAAIACAPGVLADPGIDPAEPDVDPVFAPAIDPALEPPLSPVVQPAAVALPPPPGPLPHGSVSSPPPVTTRTPDGWTLTLSAADETQLVRAPLTTAISSRSYVVGGTFRGNITGPADGPPPEGVMEVGYQIGCGIDMSTSNGVTLTGTAGVTPSVGLAGVDVADPALDGLVPVLTTPVTGGVAVGLKPGIINIVPVTEKEFRGADPWVLVSNFQVKIDGCVGQSFIRSYAFLTRSTDESDAVLAYYGETKVV
ncbi:MspA family porin [Mycolicibacterium bacteremicum]|uniref:MspA protein n=1 Tax=Mycolicibacterium bacteremicum TaxID=564198 RepID=A0A1W9YZ37_MYCBA|nr:MspA family porin [Mycolicibacterium bacteremicum]ORA05239.1 MspA protein [Mycolicibacterium bacteremicum]